MSLKSRTTFSFGILFLVAITLICSQAKGQDQSVFDRLSAKKFQTGLYISFDASNKFRYIRNDSGPHDSPLQEGQLFAFDGEDDNFFIYVKFYNPLRYSFKVNSADIDDPIRTTITQYISSALTGLPTVVTSSATSSLASAPSVSHAIMAESAEAQKHLNQVLPAIKQFDSNLLLYEWMMEFYSNMQATEGSIPGINELIDTINGHVRTVESFLYGKVKVEGIASRSVGELISQQKVELYKSENNYETFKTKLISAESVRDVLSGAQTNAKTSLDALVDILKTAKATQFIQQTQRQAFENYSKSTASSLQLTTKSLLDTRSAEVNGFRAFLESTRKAFDSFSTLGNGHAFKRVEEGVLNPRSEKARQYTLALTSLKEDGTEDKKIVSQSLTVATRQDFVPFFSASTIFSHVTFPNYSLQPEQTADKTLLYRIEETNPTRVIASPVAFLNFLTSFTNKKTTVIYWYPQIGVGRAGGNTIIPVGIGVYIDGIFSISAGYLNGIGKRLSDEYSLDRTAENNIIEDQEALDDAMETGYYGGFYVSLNFSIGIKKKQ
ncbi:MAG: hypothetical protein WD824_15780 [Cyclobacteriaceae bacterium]